TVDIKTVRLIQKNEPEAKKIPSRLWQKENGILDNQFEFDFGEHHRKWINPLLFREPIQVLDLTKRAEGCLIANGKMLLGDLIGHEIQEFVFLKGMGQGHIDEIQNKLSVYVAGRSLTRSYHIEFISWLLSLTAGIDRKKSAIYLEEFGFSNLLPLSPEEKLELRRVDLGTKKAWLSDVIAELRKNERVGWVHQDVKRITFAFVMPWLRSRFGIATENEITERLHALADDPQMASKAIEFIRDVYYRSQFPLNEYLYQVDPKIFCSSENEATAYREVIQTAFSYFYKPSVFYHLPQLTNLISRDFAKSWKNHSQGFIVAVLRRAPSIRVRKGFTGQLEVRLA
ncbi:MAG TPA: DNA-directed RNA polymerase subunit alpha C-terminal domain-containing protein, partial [Waddliaceae bacterium]